MATARETITTALQALRVKGFGQNPSSAEAEYCLKQLNGFVKQLLGFGGSLPMQNLRASSAYQVTTQWPALRVQCMGGLTVTLPSGECGAAIPDGFRLHVVDVSGGGGVSIARNGWLINGLASDYAVSGEAMLFFRADTGDWKPIGALTLNDQLPFPDDFDQGVAFALANGRLPLFGQVLNSDVRAMAEEGERRISARYCKPPPANLGCFVSNIGLIAGTPYGYAGPITGDTW